MGFSLHAHLCAEHVTALRRRVGEMREPPLGLDLVPDARLEIFFDEIRAAPTTAELILGLYEKALHAVKAALEHHIAETNPLADQPSVRVCRFALLEVDDMLKFGAQTIAGLIDGKTRELTQPWLTLLDDCLAAAGALDGTEKASGREIVRRHSAGPTSTTACPDATSVSLTRTNMGVNAEVFLYDEKFRPEPKTVMMFYKRLREVDVPEMMASIITETSDKPWDYYRDMTRQLWDEARHAMMGEAGFVSLGIDWPRRVMVNFTWSLALNTQLKTDRAARRALLHRTGTHAKEWKAV